MRPSGRRPDQLRDIRITRNYTRHAEGSVLIEFGETRVVCNVSVEEKVPNFLKGKGQGWVTAEYGMLPRSTGSRMAREASMGKQGGRTMEIQRLIGRALRSAVDMKQLGERTFTIDCDVIQADGGTRTASITGGCVALVDAINHVRQRGLITNDPLRHLVASVSCGIFGGEAILDLDYADRPYSIYLKEILASNGRIHREMVEILGSQTFSLEDMLAMTKLAQQGIRELIAQQKKALGI